MGNNANNKQINSKDQMNEFFVDQMNMQNEDQQGRVFGYDQRGQHFNQINNNIESHNQGEKIEDVQQFTKNIEMNPNFNYQNNMQGNYQGNYMNNLQN